MNKAFKALFFVILLATGIWVGKMHTQAPSHVTILIHGTKESEIQPTIFKPLLRKLEKEGYLRSQWESAGNKRKRKYYYITAKGRESVTEGTKQWNGFYKLIMRVAEVPGV